MTAATFRMELRRNRSLGLWVGLIAFVYAGTMGIFYPVMKENLAALEEYMKIFPKAFLAAFGMTGSLGEPGVFFSTYIGIWLWPIVAAIVGVIAATRPVAVDLDRGFLELVLSTPMARVRYLGTAIAVQLLLVTGIAVATIAGVLVSGAFTGAAFDTARFLAVIPLAAALGCGVAAFATVASVVSLSRGVAGGLTVAILLLMYLAYVVGQIQPDLGWLRDASAFGHFDTARLIDTGVFPTADFVLFAAVAVGCWLAALWAFSRRDLAA